jgi:hypothetical protein
MSCQTPTGLRSCAWPSPTGGSPTSMDLDPQLTLEAAHEAIVAAEKRILEVFPAADIIIHADPRGRAEPHGGAFSEAPATQ